MDKVEQLLRQLLNEQRALRETIQDLAAAVLTDDQREKMNELAGVREAANQAEKVKREEKAKKTREAVAEVNRSGRRTPTDWKTT